MELSGLKNELRHLLVIAQQLEPYIRSISSLMERIQPQVGASLEEPEVEEEEEEEEGGQEISPPPPRAAPQREGYGGGGGKGRESPPPTSSGRQGEDERIMAILERIQAMKPERRWVRSIK